MERLEPNGSTYNQPAQYTAIPAGWALVECYDGADVTILRFARRDQPRRQWVISMGLTFEEALVLGVRRLTIYDEMDSYYRRMAG